MTPAEKIREACDLLFSPGLVVELRALGDRTHYGYYTDHAKLARDAEVLESLPDIRGMYVTLNKVNPALLARCVNRVKKAGNKEPQTGDRDITRRLWFPVDIDPKRPGGISSSDEEHERALDKASKIAGFLSDIGWCSPILADSGNGAHLLYRIDLPNTPESTELIKTCLATLDQFFSDSECEIDTSVYNPARIWKLYGTVSRKGDNTKERPHRRAGILSVPDKILTLTEADLEHLASMSRDHEPRTIIPQNHLDLPGWLLSHSLSFTEKSCSGGRLFVFDRCPFSDAHKDGAYAIQFDNGAIFAGCHHNSCGGGKQRWHELRERFEGKKKHNFEEWHKKQVKDRAKAKAEQYGGPGKDTVQENSDNSFALEANRILSEENPFDYMLKTFALDHEGDWTVAKCLIMSLASRSVINSKGLHVLVTGESGKGKSHAFDTMLQQVPDELRLDGRMSDKALFYADDLKPRTSICLDDVSLSDQMQEILKGVTTSFQRPFRYRTVDKDRRGITRFIPERCVWWVAKVEGTGDDQVWNRMLTTWIDDSREQDAKVLLRELEGAMVPPEEAVKRPEIALCQQIWRELPDRWVIIPYAKRIRFSSHENRRNPGMLIDIIRAHAVLMQIRRESREYNGISCVIATEEDFVVASRLYHALNGESGGQISKLTRNEAEVIQAIVRSGMTELRVSDLQRMTGKSNGALYKMLGGYRHKSGAQYSGLLEKCPALSYLDRTDLSEGGGTSRRVRVYAWDKEIYDSWASGGECWLEGNNNCALGDDDHHDDSGRSEGEKLSSEGGTFHYETGEETLDLKNNSNNKDNFLGSSDRKMISDSQGSEILNSCDRAIRPPSTDNESYQSDGNNASVLQSGEGLVGSSYLPLRLNKEHNLPLTHRVSTRNIDPDRFIKLEKVRKSHCDVCGKRWVRYVEKGDPGRVLCERCMSKAVTREIMSVTTLPGTVNLSGLSRVDKGIGRCSICSIGNASWIGERVKICDLCYKREEKSGGGSCRS